MLIRFSTICRMKELNTGALVLWSVLTGFLTLPSAAAQLIQANPGEARPSFEVATVKPNDSGSRSMSINARPGMYIAQNVALKELLVTAYGASTEAQIVSKDDGFLSKHFDISAKEDESQASAMKKMDDEERQRQLALLLQSLLVDRFMLKVHFETKQLPVLALVIAKGGSKLTPSSSAPSPSQGSSAPGARSSDRGFLSWSRSYREAKATGKEVLMEDLARLLSQQPEAGDRKVIDKTGLTGRYDWSLHWAPEQRLEGDSHVTLPRDSESDEPSLFIALRDQLGLKLVREKGAVETVVIDQIEPPSAN